MLCKLSRVAGVHCSQKTGLGIWEKTHLCYLKQSQWGVIAVAICVKSKMYTKHPSHGTFNVWVPLHFRVQGSWINLNYSYYYTWGIMPIGCFFKFMDWWLFQLRFKTANPHEPLLWVELSWLQLEYYYRATQEPHSHLSLSWANG